MSPEKVRPDDAWSDDEVMMKKVETRSAIRCKETTHESSKKDKRSELQNAKVTKVPSKERGERKSDPLAQKSRVLVKDRESSEKSGSNLDEASVKIL